MKEFGGLVVAAALLLGVLVLDAPAATEANPVKHSMYCYDGVYNITWRVREPFLSLFRDMKIPHGPPSLRSRYTDLRSSRWTLRRSWGEEGCLDGADVLTSVKRAVHRRSRPSSTTSETTSASSFVGSRPDRELLTRAEDQNVVAYSLDAMDEQ
jgi:hypothetical protein